MNDFWRRRGRAAMNDTDFWAKLRRWSGRLSRDTACDAIAMWYALRDPDTPPWAKAILAAALGYLIIPLDLLPDPIFVDDAAMLAWALGVTSMFVHEGHYAAAHHRVDAFFGLT